MSKALILSIDGNRKIVDFEVGNSYELLRDTVGGLIECVSLSNTIDLWVNEEGKLLDLPGNLLATLLYQSVYDTKDVIVGDVIFTGGADEDGETLGLSDADLAFLLATGTY